MHFVWLTANNGVQILVNLAQITYIDVDNDGSALYEGTTRVLWVRETPNEIAKLIPESQRVGG